MPTLKEVPQVGNLLATVLAGAPMSHGALTVVPLLAPNLDDPDWLTLDEAGDGATVTEVSEDGSVPFLLDKPFFAVGLAVQIGVAIVVWLIARLLVRIIGVDAARARIAGRPADPRPSPTAAVLGRTSSCALGARAPPLVDR